MTRSHPASGVRKEVLDILVAGELVQAGDCQRRLHEPVPGAGGFEIVVRHDLEPELEPAGELVLPLLGEAAGADDQTAFQVATGDEFLDQEPRHDGLAGPGVVSQQESQWLPRQHGVVDSGYLVGKRIHHRGVHSKDGIVEVGQVDALSLGNEPEEMAVAVERPGEPLLDHVEGGLRCPGREAACRRSQWPAPCRSIRRRSRQTT